MKRIRGKIDCRCTYYKYDGTDGDGLYTRIQELQELVRMYEKHTKITPDMIRYLDDIHFYTGLCNENRNTNN